MDLFSLETTVKDATVLGLGDIMKHMLIKESDRERTKDCPTG